MAAVAIGGVIACSRSIGMLPSMSRPMLPPAVCLLLRCCWRAWRGAGAHAAGADRHGHDRVSPRWRASTCASTGRRRRTQGELSLTARRVDAPDLGYRFRDLRWHCPLRRDGSDGWRCEGELRSGRAARRCACRSTWRRPARDAALRAGARRLRIAPASGDARTTRASTSPACRWPGRRPCWRRRGRTRSCKAGTLDGAPRRARAEPGPLRIAGTLAIAGAALETPDATHRRREPRRPLRPSTTARLAQRDDCSRSTARCAAANSSSATPTSRCRRRRSALHVEGRAATQARAGSCRDRLARRRRAASRRQRRRSIATPACATLDLHLHSADLAPLRDALPVRLARRSPASATCSWPARSMRDVRIVDGALQSADVGAARRRHGRSEGALPLRWPRRRRRGSPPAAPVARRAALARRRSCTAWTSAPRSLPIDSSDGELRLRDAGRPCPCSAAACASTA